jgi:hypothetical protein
MSRSSGTSPLLEFEMTRAKLLQRQTPATAEEVKAEESVKVPSVVNEPIDIDTRNIDDVRRLVMTLNNNSKLVIENLLMGATSEQLVSLLFKTYADEIKSAGRNMAAKGVIGAGAQQSFIRRIQSGNEFVCISEPGVYQHQIMSLDSSTAFDYASNISVHLHFGADVSVFEAETTEVYLTCCRFTVYSSRVTVTKTINGELVGEATLLKMPHLIPMRHTVQAPSWIMLREHGRLVQQVDIHMHTFVSVTLLDDHFFCTPANLPVRVSGGMGRFDRNEFLSTVPDRFRHRYQLPEETAEKK